MERLTATVMLPKDGKFREYSLKEREEIKRNSRISLEEIYRRLQKYENTGLAPEEIVKMQADNAKVRELLKDDKNNQTRYIAEEVNGQNI